MSRHHEGHRLAELCAGKAGECWQDAAYSAFLTVAREHATFTTGFVRRWFRERNGPAPHDNRAWGAIARRAVRSRVIKHTGRWEATGSHHRPDAVWRSMIVEKR